MSHEKNRNFDEDLAVLIARAHKTSTISLKEIVGILSRKGPMLILIFLSLPFCQPIQIPGLSIPFGIVIAFLGLRVVLGKQLWLPKRLLIKPISSQTIEKLAKKFQNMMKKMRRFIHPRLNFVIQYGSNEIVSGVLICLLGLILALPLPIPFTNLAAGWSLFLTCLGLLEDDGLFVLFGYTLSLVTFLFLLALIFSITGALA